MIVSASAGREGADEADWTGSERITLENAVAKSRPNRGKNKEEE